MTITLKYQENHVGLGVPLDGVHKPLDPDAVPKAPPHNPVVVLRAGLSLAFSGEILSAPSIIPPSRSLLIARIVSIAACNVRLALKFFRTTGKRSASLPGSSSARKGCSNAPAAVGLLLGSTVRHLRIKSLAVG